MTENFVPGQHLRTMHGGSLYMDVADRKVWLQSVTDASMASAFGYTITTDLHTLTDRLAVFRAELTLVDANGVVLRRVTGWGSETPADFGDYIEKAETKAVGRALANAGFGTANAEPENGLIVDAPRGGEQRQAPQSHAAPNGNGNAPVSIMNPNAAPTQKQVDFYMRLCVEKGFDPAAFAQASLGVSLQTVTKGQISDLIDAIKMSPEAGAAAPLTEAPF